MNKKYFRSLSVLILVFALLFTNLTGIFAEKKGINLEDVVNDTAKYMYEAVSHPMVGSVGGEWAVIGLARSGYDIPNKYYEDYYKLVEEYVKDKDGDLHNVKYTEYSRVIIALSSLGIDARDIGGYDLTKPLGDFEKTIYQGLNGPIWALIALDSGNYPMPKNENARIQASRDMYIKEILDRQLKDGGWSLFGGKTEESKKGESDPDITGMALQALAKYQDKPEVKKASDEAVESMSRMQNSQGGYSSWGSENSESCVQIIVALTELGIDLDDERFIKNGKSLLDNLLTFYREGNGFVHVQEGGGSDQMASEQGFYGIVAALRARDGKNSLYRMSDAKPIKIDKSVKVYKGLENKNQAVNYRPVINHGLTFPDISGVNAHKNHVAIESLASRGIISGKTENNFDPDASMTRAEFATIIVKALGIEEFEKDVFQDVRSRDWFYKYVAVASEYGLVSGKSSNEFKPNDTITKEEAAVMVERAAKVAGMKNDIDTAGIRDILAQFDDYVKVGEWSRASLAFCYREGILIDNNFEINAKAEINRAEIAQMVFNMLGKANLL